MNSIESIKVKLRQLADYEQLLKQSTDINKAKELIRVSKVKAKLNSKLHEMYGHLVDAMED